MILWESTVLISPSGWSIFAVQILATSRGAYHLGLYDGGLSFGGSRVLLLCG